LQHYRALRDDACMTDVCTTLGWQRHPSLDWLSLNNTGKRIISVFSKSSSITTLSYLFDWLPVTHQHPAHATLVLYG
jgi:hypothetical protein